MDQDWCQRTTTNWEFINDVCGTGAMRNFDTIDVIVKACINKVLYNGEKTLQNQTEMEDKKTGPTVY